MSLPNISGHA